MLNAFSMEKNSFGKKDVVCHATWQRFKRPPKGLGVVVEYHEVLTRVQFKAFLTSFLLLSDPDQDDIKESMKQYLSGYAELDRKQLQVKMSRLIASNHRKRKPRTR